MLEKLTERELCNLAGDCELKLRLLENTYKTERDYVIESLTLISREIDRKREDKNETT